MPRIMSQPGIYRKELKNQWWNRSRGFPSSCSAGSTSSSSSASSMELSSTALDRAKPMEGMSYRVEERDHCPASKGVEEGEWGYYVDFQSPYSGDDKRKTFGKFSTVDGQRE